MALLIAVLIGLGCYTSNCWALTQCLAGPRTIGKWTGTQNAIGNLAGVTAPVVTGWLVAQTGTFRAAFFCAAAVLAAGAALYRLLPDPSRLESAPRSG
jgi:nitrate/nitrite transporter NarK